jgi:anthraniloyl-CoA monooxygenase
MRIACVGAGPAGLYLSILMKKRDPRHEVTVYERNPAGTTYGWGVVFWDDLLDDLRASDPETARDIAAQSFRWTGVLVDVEGKPAIHEPGTGYSIRRQRLFDILATRATELGVRIVYEREIDDRAGLPEADVIVAADGVGSHFRKLRGDAFGTRIAVGRNKYVWLGTTRVFEAFTFAFAHTQAGWIWFHAYAFDEKTSTLIVECSPETWAGLGFDAMPAQESLARLKRIFARHLGGEPLITQDRDETMLPWLNFRTVTNECWHAGNVALVGDAAHTTHFAIGSGTRLAMQDAISLCANLSTHAEVAAALAAYGNERKAALARPQREARFSARWFENIERYIGLDTPQFYALLQDRRSRLIPHLPPLAYYRLYKATRDMTVLRALRDLVARRIAGRPSGS